MVRNRALWWAASVLIITVLEPSVALAHRLNVFAYVVGDEVAVEAYFSDGVKARGADVKVYGAGGALLVEGKTDRNGEYAFRLPVVAHDLKIVATSGDEHRGEYTLKAEEFEGLVGIDEPEGPEEGSAGSVGAGNDPEGVAPLPLDGRDLDEIKAALARIDASLRTMQRQLAQLRKPRAGPSIEQVMAGLGFIIGLTGVAMYFMARNAARK